MGSEMCIRDRHPTIRVLNGVGHGVLRSPAGIRALRSFLESGSGP